MTVRLRVLLCLVLWCAIGGSSLAVEPDEILPSAQQEARARSITRELRCVVCQNQSVDDSDAPLAKDIRVLVRERVASGETDEQVRDYIVQRYGKFVLLRPPFEGDTVLLWIGPFAIFLTAVTIAAFYIWRRGNEKNVAPPLTATEELDLNRLLQDTTP
ncbi:MAG: cytochrome c-type biogenesis protein [Micropepsaceae bacterium]